jgi:DNA-binding transcriptional LysR family regulator
VLDRAANAAGATLRAQAEVDGVRLLASLALDGYGATIVPATAVPTWLTGSFRRITVPELPRRVVAFVYRRRPTPSAPTLAVLRALHTIIDAAAENQPGVHKDTNPLSRQS